MPEFYETDPNIVTKDSNKKISAVGKTLILATGGVGIALSVICAPFVSPALRKVCLPYVPATTEQIVNVTQALRGRLGTLIDIGSGDGRIVIEAAKTGFKSYGVELNPWLVQYSRIAAFKNGVSANAKFYRKDLWKLDLRPFRNVVIFGVEEMMKDFERKLLEEVESDTVVIACRFPLPNLEPLEVHGHGVDTVWKYRITK